MKHDKLNKQILQEGLALKNLLKYTKNISEKTKITDLLSNIVHEYNILGYQDKNNNAYLLLPEKGITHANSTVTKDFFIHALTKKYKVLSDRKKIGEFVGNLEALCRTHLIKHNAFKRTAMRDGKIYFDLCNSKSEVVEIDSEGCRIITEPPVIFIREQNMEEVPAPKLDAEISDIYKIKRYFNLGNPDQDVKLLICYLIHILFPETYPGGKIVLALEGSQGSAKSSFSKCIKSLIDPNANNMPKVPNNSKDILLYAKSQYLLVFDNFSTITKKQSDQFCMLATGSGLTLRRLYSDCEMLSFSVKSPLIINSIGNVVTRGDLIDRSICFFLPSIKKRVAETNLWQAFSMEKPQLLGALFNILSKTLKYLPEVSVKENFRMQDFAKISMAVEKAMGWEKDSFTTLYKNNICESAGENLHSNPVGRTVLYLIRNYYLKDGGNFVIKHSPDELFKRLRSLNFTEDDNFSNTDFPQKHNSFSKELYRISSEFKKLGISIDRGKSNGERYISISANSETLRKDLI